MSARITVTVWAFALALALAPAAAHALGPLTFAGGTLRLAGSPEETGGRNLVLKGQTLILSFPGITGIERQTLKSGEGAIREARLAVRGGHAELELRLADRAEKLLPRLRLETRPQQLLIRIEGDAERASAPAAPAAAPTTVATPKLSPPLPPEPAPAPAPVLGRRGSAADLWARPAAPGGVRGAERSSFSLWGITLALAAAGAVTWYLKKRRRGPASETTQIEVVACRMLSGKHRLLLVEAAGELLLLGCTEKEIRLLRTVSRRKLQQREERAEQDFFDAGAQMDAENTDSPRPAERPSVAARLETVPEPAFVLPPAPVVHAPIAAEAAAAPASKSEAKGTRRRSRRVVAEEPALLDENWALGILKLRRGGGSSCAPPTDSLH